jgi:amino acid transporter
LLLFFVVFSDTFTVSATFVAILFIIGLALINFRGVSESVKANVVLTCIELSGLLIIIAIGIFAVLAGEGDPSRLTQIDPAPNQHALVAITSATALAFFAMVGFEDSVNMAEETRDPVRIFPRAMLWGMVIAAVIYVLVAITSSLLIPADELSKAGSSALLRVVTVGAPGFPLWIFSLIGLFAVINSALINMLMASRLIYGMSNERIIPKVFGTVHPFRRTPWISIVFASGVAIILVSTTDIAKLGGTTALLLLIVFTIVNVAVLVLRKEKADHKHFRAPTTRSRSTCSPPAWCCGASTGSCTARSSSTRRSWSSNPLNGGGAVVAAVPPPFASVLEFVKHGNELAALLHVPLDLPAVDAEAGDGGIAIGQFAQRGQQRGGVGGQFP